jgi:3-methyladenine DNA glycosylase/8-oxoguanine DNA glycosylase
MPPAIMVPGCWYNRDENFTTQWGYRMQKKPAAANGISIPVVKPYDLTLSLSAMRSFGPARAEQRPRFRIAARMAGKAVIIEVSQDKENKLMATSRPASDNSQVRTIVEWVLFIELDLKPFYRLIAGNPKLAFITQNLYGLKPSRPASLFEMAVTAITEQQLSLASAYSIRNRIVQRFGEPVGDLRVFPEPEALAKASLKDLRSCGLSRQKSEYIRGLANEIVAGSLDLDSLKSMDIGKARELLMNLRGFGRWSADYVLVRGLARTDCVPSDDLGIRDVIGQYLGTGHRLTSQEVNEKLEPFRPYRGLLAFYFLVAHRLNIDLSN